VTTVDYQQLLQRVDSVLRSRVLVYGSLPPDARDLDLLVGPDDAAAIEEALRADGFRAWNHSLVAFRGCTVLVVELIPAAGLGLPTAELDALYREAVPLPHLSQVAEPSPHHTLLILARRLAGARVLRPKHRTRIDRAVAFDAGAWEKANDRAHLWAAESALARLQSLHGGRAGYRRRHPPRPRRTRVIAIAGTDGDRITSHAHSLRESLARLGFSAIVEQKPIRRSRLGEVLSLWRPLCRHLGRGTVLIYDLSPGSRSASNRILGPLSPRPLRSYVIDARRSRDEVCEELAEDAWLALIHRTRPEAMARQVMTAIRRRSARVGRE